VEVRTLQRNEVLAIPSHIQQLSDIFQFSNIDNKNAIMETPVAISNTEELQEARLYRYNKEHNFWDTTVLDTEFDEASSTIKVNLSELNQVPFFIGKIQGKGTGLSLEDLNNIPSMPLAPTAKFNRANLPNSYDLSSHMPPVRSQGSQGSCVGWATGYYLKSYHEHIENQTTYGVGDDYSNVYSPAFIYNAIKVSDCQSGSYFEDALSRLQNVGISSWNDMPYSETHCDTQPSSVAIDNAKCAKITSYQYIYHKNMTFSIDTLKNYLTNNQPIVVGVTIYNGFDGQYSRLANKEFIYNNRNLNTNPRGGHAIVVVGYDDTIKAFKIINSWGKGWANDGYLWIDYGVFEEILSIAYISTDEIGSCKEQEVSNQPPVVNAESNKNADEITTVTLNATASDSDGYIAKAQWTQTGGITVVIDNANTLNASFVAPSVDSDTQLTFQLTVTDDNGATASDTVVVTVKNTTVPNQSPIANAGVDATVNEGDTTILDGSNSYDSDGIIASAQWEQISGTIVQLKSMDSSLRQYFTSPQVDGDEQLKFKLTIADDKGSLASDTIVVTVKNTTVPNQSPIANAGSDITANEGESVTLDASGSSGDIVSYEWREGDRILSTQSSFSKSDFFVGTHTITLTLADSNGAEATDEVQVNVTSDTNSITQFISNLENNTTNLSQFIEYDGAIYVLTAEKLNETDYRTDPDGMTSYKSLIVLTKIVNGNIMAKVEIDKLYVGSLNSLSGALRRGAIGVSGDKIKIVFNEKNEYARDYGQTGYAYLVDLNTLEFTKETLFTQSNWGWYPYIDSNGDVIHFSFAGYYLYKNSTYLYDIAPTVASKDMQNQKLILAGRNGNLTAEIAWEQLAFELIDSLKSKI
jgi:C1A family cysteine protease